MICMEVGGMKKKINEIIPLGVLALNCIIGGLIGGIIVFVRIIAIFMEIIKIAAGHFWTQCPKV